MNIKPLFYKTIFLVLLTGLTIGCKKKTEFIDDFYIGSQSLSVLGYGHYDYSHPILTFLEFKNDSLFVIDLKNKSFIKAKANYQQILKGDTLPVYIAELDTVLNLSFEQRYNQGILKFSLKSRSVSTEYHFQKPIKTSKWSKEHLLKTLTQGAYTTTLANVKSPNRDLEIKKTLHFTEDSLTTHYSYYYQNLLMHQEQHTKPWAIYEKQSLLFFTEGNPLENPHKLVQISDLSKNSFEIYYYSDQKEIFETFELTALDENFETKNYSSCFEMRPFEYYHGKFKYLKGNDYILNKVKREAPQATGDGYITVHFIVNCKNEIGQLGLEQMDRNFQSTSFEPALIRHIIQETLKLNGWSEVEHPKDIHAFLMFKIENGKIIDLCP